MLPDRLKNYLIKPHLEDKPHIVLIDKIIAAYDSLDVKEDTIKLLHFFLEVVLEHFKFEEEYMSSIFFPNISAHQESHTKILIRITNDVERFINTKSYSIGALYLSQIKETLLFHIEHSDRQVYKFLNMKKTKESTPTELFKAQ